jgi:hypothetical protein
VADGRDVVIADDCRVPGGSLPRAGDLAS